MTHAIADLSLRERRVEFTYQPDDAGRFNLHVMAAQADYPLAQALGRRVRLTSLLTNCFILAGFVALFVLMRQTSISPWWNLPVVFGVILFGATAIQWLFNPDPLGRHVRQTTRLALGDDPRQHYGRRQVVINPRHIIEVTAFAEHRLAWSAVMKIENTPTDIYVFNSPMSAIVIPRRGFATPRDADAFFGLAMQYHAMGG